MSSKRYQQQDFRLIVGLRDGARGLQPAEVRTPIDGRTRITWLNESGGVGGSSLVDPDSEETTDGEGGGGGAGGRPDGTDGGSLVGLPDGIDADFVPDDVFESVPSVNDLFDGIVSSNYGNGERFQAVDCDTGQCIEINTSGDFAPPTGWDDVDNGPPLEGWEQGYYYRWNAGGKIGLVFTCQQARQAAAANSFCPPPSTWNTGICPTSFANANFFCSGVGNTTISITRLSCLIDPNAQFCVSEAPRPSTWPIDNCTQLVQGEDGRWGMHPKEPDRITKYEQGASFLSDICSGSRRYQPLPGINGGLVLWDYTNNIFRYKDPATGVISFGSSSGLNGVVDRTVRGLTVDGNQPFIKAAGSTP